MSERGASGGVDGEAELLNALASGSETAFETVYTRYAAGLLRAAAGVCGSQAMAEDAVQEAFVGLVRNGSRVREIRNLRAYLFTAVIRAARKAPRLQPLSLDPERHAPASATSSDSDSPQSERLDRALTALPAEQREVITLHIDGGMTFDEIAGALNISANTVSSRYRYAMEKLRSAMHALPREAPQHG